MTNKPTSKNKNQTVSADQAQALQERIRQLGDYAHVEVHASRGHLNIEPDAHGPVARATPIASGIYGLSFRSHTGRWEPMPVTGDLNEVAAATVDMLGPYLVSVDFSGGT